MIGAVSLTALVVIVLVNSALAALLTRFLRVRMNTGLGSLLYVLLLVPLVLVVLVPVHSLIFGRFVQFGTSAMLLAVSVVVPLAVGLTFDYFWMPAPDEVEIQRRTS